MLDIMGATHSDVLSVYGLFASHVLLQVLQSLMSYLHSAGHTSHPHSLCCCAVTALICQYFFGPRTTLCVVCLNAVTSAVPEGLGLWASAARIAALTVAAQVDQIVSTTHRMTDCIKARFLPAPSTPSTSSTMPGLPRSFFLATHLKLNQPNRPNDLMNSAVIGPCIMPEEQPNVVKLSLSHKPAQARWSDVVVICGNVTLEAHKVILCSQSEYFERICDSKFIEGTTNSIDLSEESLSVVQAMMAFLYGAQIQARVEEDRLRELNFWVDLYTLADRVIIPSLVTEAAQGFYRSATNCWTSEAFFSVCREVYSREPTRTAALRGKICALIAENLQFLSKRVDFAALLQDEPEIAAEVLLNLGKSLTTLKCGNAKCSKYNKQWSHTRGFYDRTCTVCFDRSIVRVEAPVEAPVAQST